MNNRNSAVVKAIDQVYVYVQQKAGVQQELRITTEVQDVQQELRCTAGGCVQKELRSKHNKSSGAR